MREVTIPAEQPRLLVQRDLSTAELVKVKPTIQTNMEVVGVSAKDPGNES